MLSSLDIEPFSIINVFVGTATSFIISYVAYTKTKAIKTNNIKPVILFLLIFFFELLVLFFLFLLFLISLLVNA